MNTVKDKIVLIGDYDYNEQQVLKKSINNLQQQLDINPMLLQIWLNDDSFRDFLESKYRDCYREIMNRSNPVLDKLMDVSHVESFIDEYLFWEKEMCGQVIDEFGNGYIKYCNKHKYLHPNNSIKKANTDQTDHVFVRKTANEILEEQIFKVKFNMYLQLTRNLAQAIENEFYQYISKTYQEFYIPIEESDSLVTWLKEHKDSFRSKFPIFERDLIDIKNEKKNSQTRTFKSLRTLKTLKNAKKNKTSESESSLKQNNDDMIDLREQKIYIKVFISPNDNTSMPNCKFISRSTL